MRALIVEDNPLYSELLQIILEENGFHVTAAKDGLEAIGILSPPSSPFHLIISDFNMPQVDGKELVVFILANKIQFEKMFILSGLPENCDVLAELIKDHEKIQFVSKAVPLETLKEKYFKL